MRVTDLRVYPVKALDGTAVGTARITPGGTLAGDRTYALFGPRGDPINGKRTPLVHELDADLDQDSAVLAVAGDGETRTFDLDAEREAAEAWFSDYFGIETTIEAVASWFDGLIRSVGTVYRDDRTPSCGRSGNDLQPTL